MINEMAFLDQLADALYPDDDGLAMILIEAHFDESVGQKKPNITCLAGYVFEQPKAKKMSREWSAVLRQHGLPYFRMSECAHGNGPFRKMSKPQRVEIATAMIQIIKNRAALGLAATVDNDEFKELVPKHKWVGTPYSLLSRVVMGGVPVWADEKGIAAKIRYVFEAGHSSMREANSIMEGIVSRSDMREYFRYQGHAFVLKEDNPGVQAADLLAWQWYTDKRHSLEGRPRRKDLESLLNGLPHMPMHIDRPKLIEMMDGIRETANERGVGVQDVAVV